MVAWCGGGGRASRVREEEDDKGRRRWAGLASGPSEREGKERERWAKRKEVAAAGPYLFFDITL